MQSPALHQLLDVPRADVTQTRLQAALLRALVLQPASQRVAQTGEVLRMSVGQQSSQSLLPVVQLAALHDVSPVLRHN